MELNQNILEFEFGTFFWKRFTLTCSVQCTYLWSSSGRGWRRWSRRKQLHVYWLDIVDVHCYRSSRRRPLAALTPTTGLGDLGQDGVQAGPQVTRPPVWPARSLLTVIWVAQHIQIYDSRTGIGKRTSFETYILQLFFYFMNLKKKPKLDPCLHNFLNHDWLVWLVA